MVTKKLTNLKEFKEALLHMKSYDHIMYKLNIINNKHI